MYNHVHRSVLWRKLLFCQNLKVYTKLGTNGYLGICQRRILVRRRNEDNRYGIFQVQSMQLFNFIKKHCFSLSHLENADLVILRQRVFVPPRHLPQQSSVPIIDDSIILSYLAVLPMTWWVASGENEIRFRMGSFVNIFNCNDENVICHPSGFFNSEPNQ